MKITWQDIKYWIIDPLTWGLALVGLYVIVGAGDACANDQTLPAYAAQMETKYELPAGLLVATCEQESHWRNVAGQHGEIGVCQIKPDTVRMICPSCADNGKQLFIQRGTKGDVVRKIQADLARSALYVGPIDGIYGPVTERAVRDFQALRNLSADGIVGPKTWARMFNDPYPGGTIASALWDPHKNIEWAAAYLAWLKDNVSPEPLLMMAAYNGGPGNPVVRYMLGVNKRLARNGI